jgi:hypothetical protein
MMNKDLPVRLCFISSFLLFLLLQSAFVFWFSFIKFLDPHEMIVELFFFFFLVDVTLKVAAKGRHSLSTIYLLPDIASPSSALG